ncbi:MAG: DUF3568 family protein [Oscillospiraceae bacterium]|nr:DUF3568 family protein [Oscillospiraceae bacterium]
MKKRKIIVSCVAVILAVAMLAGGTFTYLTGESREVVNTITANYNSVELHETDPETGDPTQGNEYEIVPGMSDDKDPVVTVNYTLDSYVYVTVTDITDELIEYMIASGWTEITDLESTDANTGAVTKVYYQLVTTEDTDARVNTTMSTNSVTVYTKTLEVLENNSISYATSITNEQMLDAGGNLIEDLSLTFKAYIMQADPFLSNNTTEYDGAIAAYYAMLDDSSLIASHGYKAMANGVLYETVGEAVSAALTSGGTSTITLYDDSS